MDWLLALQTLLTKAKAASPIIQDLTAVAEKAGADVSVHKPVVQDFTDALAGLEKALADATGIL